METINHYPVKQVIILRKDLNYGTQGKKIAQACHASMKIFFDRMDESDSMQEVDGKLYEAIFTKDMHQWIKGSFAKIILVVPTDKELLELAEEAKQKNFPVAIIEDDGATVFHGIKTLTAIAIGPVKSELLDEITHKDYVKLL